MATTVLVVAAAATESTREMAFSRAHEPITVAPPRTSVRLVAGWCGPEVRCVQTAEALGWPATPDRGLRDLEAGRWTGRSAAELMRSEPDDFSEWMLDPAFRIGDGESIAHLTMRARFWAHDAGGSGWPDGRVALIVAPMMVRAMVLALVNWPPEDGRAIDVAPLDVFEVRGTPGRWRLRAGRNLGDRHASSSD